MKTLFSILILIYSISFSSAEAAKIKVVCTLPTLKSITQEVGGDRVDVIALAKGDQDPHFVTPTPVLMKKTREAELFIENGYSLELWANEVTNGSGNAKIMKSGPGRIVASKGIPSLEVPSVISREQGDIHPEGNPHVWLDPLFAKVQATNIANALKAADPAGSDYYESRKKAFHDKVDQAMFGPELLKLVGIQKLSRVIANGEISSFLETQIGGQKLSTKAGGWLKASEAFRGKKAYEFHKVWIYFARAFGLQLVGTIEERPGIPAGPQHVKKVTETIKAQSIPLILVDNFYDPSLPKNIAKQTGANVILLPNQVEGEPAIKTYFDLMDHIIQKIAAGAK